jgi:hypothetical protein
MSIYEDAKLRNDTRRKVRCQTQAAFEKLVRSQPEEVATIALATLEVGAIASLSAVGRAHTAFYLTRLARRIGTCEEFDF